MTMLAVAEPAPQRLEDGPTLARWVGALWEELLAGRPVACPICCGEMRPAYGQHAHPLGGACQACGSMLS